jgi:hypothetical protein
VTVAQDNPLSTGSFDKYGEVLSAGLERDGQVNLLTISQEGHAHGFAHLIVVEPREQLRHSVYRLSVHRDDEVPRGNAAGSS